MSHEVPRLCCDLKTMIGISAVGLATYFAFLTLLQAYSWADILAEWNQWKYGLGRAESMPMDVWSNRFLVRVGNGYLAFALVALLVSAWGCALTVRCRWLFPISVVVTAVGFVCWAALIVRVVF
jgi:hypothetical protein